MSAKYDRRAAYHSCCQHFIRLIFCANLAIIANLFTLFASFFFTIIFTLAFAGFPGSKKILVLNIFSALKLYSTHKSLKFRESRLRLSRGQFRQDNIVLEFFKGLYKRFNISEVIFFQPVFHCDTPSFCGNSSQKFWYSSCDIVIPPFRDE